jgi:hypothetical protein
MWSADWVVVDRRRRLSGVPVDSVAEGSARSERSRARVHDLELPCIRRLGVLTPVVLSDLIGIERRVGATGPPPPPLPIIRGAMCTAVVDAPTTLTAQAAANCASAESSLGSSRWVTAAL